ncbi:MAG TPA: choice-of-anchor R domain-containing protein [Clostridia bacterium]
MDEVKRAQTFTAPDNINMSSIEIMIEKLGGTTQSDVLVELYATDGTRPTGSPLKSTTIPASSVGESHSVINVPLSYNLNSGTKYAIVLSQVTPIDDTICYAWSTAEINSNERLFKYTSGSWVDEGSLGDGWLKVYYQKNSNVIDISNTNATGLTLGLPSDEMKRGQTFTASKNMNISSVEVYIRKNGGTAQSNLKVELYATDGVKPTGSALASATYPASSISSNMSNIKIPFISNTLTAGTKYAIVVSQVTPNSTSNYLWATTETNGSVGMFKWIGSSWIDESSIGDGSLKVNFN